MTQLHSTYLEHLDKGARLKELEHLVENARKANGTAAAYLVSRVKQFELRYEMDSDELLRRLSEGEQSETAEIAEWLFLLDALRSNGG